MRIGIVNDMAIAREALRRVVAADASHRVAWLAADGAEAVAAARRDPVDLVLMDLIMPRVDGVEATRRIMAESPCPILVVTATVSGTIGKVYEAMGLGALRTPSSTPTLGSTPRRRPRRGGADVQDRDNRQIDRQIWLEALDSTFGVQARARVCAWHSAGGHRRIDGRSERIGRSSG